MPTPLRVLILEDRPDDAELMVRELRQSGFDPGWQRVETEPDFLAGLDPAPDLILSDYTLPEFSGRRALQLLKERGADIPLIIVSGTIGEDVAVEALRQGAADYLLKDRLARLGPAVTNALEQKRLRDDTHRADQLLRQSEERFSKAFRASPVAICITTLPEGRFLDVNDSFLSLLGYDREEVIGRTALELEMWVDPRDRERLGQWLAEQRSVRSAEGRFRTKRGDLRVALASAESIRLGGQPCALVLLHDITERKQAEEALHQINERFHLVSYATNDAVWDWDIVAHQAWWNNGVETLFGYPVSEAESAVDWWERHIHPEDQPKIMASVRAALDGGEQFWSKEYRFRRADGSYAYVFDRGYVIQDAQGKPVRMIGAIMDITERKRTEAAEHEQRALAEALRDTAAALSSTLDRDELLGRILENAGRVVPHETANIMLIESGVARIVRGRGYAERGLEAAALALRVPVADLTNLHQMVETGQPLAIPDIRTHTAWAALPGMQWIRSYVGAPIRIKGQVIGFINLDSTVPGFFTPTHAERLQVFADQAASALENARLLDETRQRLLELEAVAKISTALRAAHTLDEILPALMDAVLAVLGTDSGAIWLYDPKNAELYPGVARGWSLPIRLEQGEGFAWHAFATGEVYVAHEFQADPRAPESMRAQIPAGVGGAVVPIRTAQETIGIIVVAVRLPREILPNEVRLLTTAAEIAGNAIHRMRLHEQTEQRLQRLGALRAIDTTISSSLDLNVTLKVFLDQVTTQLRVDAASVLLLNPHLQVLEFAAGRGFRSPAIERSHPRLGQGYAGRAALERRTIGISGQPRDGDVFLAPTTVVGEGFVAYYAVPLIAKGRVTGVLEIFHRSPLNPDPEWLDFLEALAAQAAIAIDNAELFEGMQRSNVELALAYDTTLEGWSRALDLRDRETEGHTLRVTEMTLRLARAMGLRVEALEHARRGALLHDIGKMGIPDNILLKPGPLSDEEWIIMRQHPLHAYELLSPITYLRLALDIPYCHHEKWDGSGYPRGLKGEQIPLAARIFAVVDVWDALRSSRPYRQGWPEAKVREHIRSLAGTHFDPQVVEVFLRMMSEGRWRGLAP